MRYKSYYISSFDNDSGLDTSYEPFLIPEKAFPILQDAFVWRGRVRKRDGFQFLGRLRRVINDQVEPNTNGTLLYTADILDLFLVNEPNSELQRGTIVITISQGNPDETIYEDNGSGVLQCTFGPYIGGGVVHYNTPGTIQIGFTPDFQPAAGIGVTVTFSYFPMLPVMALPTRETTAINAETLYAFDTRYAYQFIDNEFSELSPGTVWNGTNSQFFWCLNYFQSAANTILFWATNFNATGGTPDPIRYWNNVAWTNFSPLLNGATRLQQCRVIISYKDRLIVFNTYEGANLAGSVNFPQRARWSQNGTPIDVNAWRDDVVGRGGFLDAPTSEQIISAEFVKDVLLVKFERSSWKLLYTGNETLPFIFQKINTELGAESTFSLVPFDKGVFSVGNVGILTDDSVNVNRIDVRIPQLAFNINNENDGVKRVYGIRDYYNELVYWTFPDSIGYPEGNESRIFPNNILVFNYINNTWAIFNDSFTCFGYFQRNDNLTWANLPYLTWASWDTLWSSGETQSKFVNIVAGNQQGFIEIIGTQVQNDNSLTISNIIPQALPDPVQIVSPNHNLKTGQFIKITSIVGTGVGDLNPTTLNNIVYRVTTIDRDTFTLEFLGDDGITNKTLEPGGTYYGGGLIQVFNNINIYTKIFAPFYESGKQVRLGYVDFLFDKTTDGEISVNLYINESEDEVINDPLNPTNTLSILGFNVVLTRPESNDIPYQQIQKKIWHRLHTSCIAQNYQLQLTFDDLEMFNELVTGSSFVMHAMTMYLSENARLLQ